jgi:hypothetical protein
LQATDRILDALVDLQGRKSAFEQFPYVSDARLQAWLQGRHGSAGMPK